jgi:hypothetical protein
MGQQIEIQETTRLGNVLVVSTDRSLSGQDGETYRSGAEADAGNTFPARLAARLFAADSRIEHVYVMSNTVSIGRSGGWEDGAVSTASNVVVNFFTFYPENATSG